MAILWSLLWHLSSAICSDQWFGSDLTQSTCGVLAAQASAFYHFLPWSCGRLSTEHGARLRPLSTFFENFNINGIAVLATVPSRQAKCLLRWGHLGFDHPALRCVESRDGMAPAQRQEKRGQKDRMITQLVVTPSNITNHLQPNSSYGAVPPSVCVAWSLLSHLVFSSRNPQYPWTFEPTVTNTPR